MKEIINSYQTSISEQKIFLGPDLSIQRYDKFKYEKFYKNFQQQLSFFWRPEEVSLTKDRNDFHTLSESKKRIFTLNLKYQTLLDSVQSRAIPFLTQYVTVPELEAASSTWQMFETLHSYAYTYIVKNVYPDTGVVFDDLLEDKMIMKRAASVTKHYNALIDSKENLKEKIYLTLMSVNILEGIRFYVSFACSYAFAENKLLEGSAKILNLINRDENVHLALTQTILNILRKDESEGFVEIAKNCEAEVTSMFEEAAKEEMEWAEYLFEEDSLMGLNDKLLVQYMKWLTNRRMKAIGLTPIFSKPTNPLGWLDNWVDSKKLQVAPQETEIETYKVGSSKQDVEDVDFDKFDL